MFSKTSFQLQKISPGRPRAVYFNDDTYVGWVQGSDVIELGATDPEQGAVFYTLEPNQAGQPRVLRDRSSQTHQTLRNGQHIMATRLPG